MPIPVWICEGCGKTVFPRRSLCSQCGGAEWRRRDADGGVVVEQTFVRHVAGGAPALPVRIGTVVLDAGPRVVARLEAGATLGAPVRLDLEDGAPVARTRPPR